MKRLIAAGAILKKPRLVSCLLISLLSAGYLPAVEIYNLDFSEPETGAYQIVSGNPSVQSSAGSLNDALVFGAGVGGDQIYLPIGVTGPRYELQYDLLVHGLLDSDYAFVMRLDASGVRSLNLHGGLNSIYAYQASPFINQTVGSFSDDTVYHIGVSVDVAADLWSVAINGSPSFSSSLHGATLQGIRFGLGPWIGGAADAPGTHAAIDNLILTVIPEPSAAAFAVAGLLVWGWRARGKH
jgi:hypothetical protein